MAKYNNACGLCFNDNDGGESWFVHSQCLYDYARLVRIKGRFRAKIRALKLCWRAINELDRSVHDLGYMSGHLKQSIRSQR